MPARGRLGLTPVTGDYVELDAGGAIARVLPRAGTVTRRAAGRATGAQVLAANVDLALVVEALPAPRVRRAERLAALAAAGGVPAALVLTKADWRPATPARSLPACAAGSASPTPSRSPPPPATASASCARCWHPEAPPSCSARRAPASRRS